MAIPLFYFKKEILSNITVHGVPWEDIGDDTGVIATSDAAIIFKLSNLADRHTGGVIRIDEPQYSELKKNSNLIESGLISGITKTPIRADQPFYKRNPAKVAEPVAADVINNFPSPSPQPPVEQPTPPAPAESPARKVRRGKAPKFS